MIEEMKESSYTEYNELAQLTISLDNDVDLKKLMSWLKLKL